MVPRHARRAGFRYARNQRGDGADPRGDEPERQPPGHRVARRSSCRAATAAATGRDGQHVQADDLDGRARRPTHRQPAGRLVQRVPFGDDRAQPLQTPDEANATPEPNAAARGEDAAPIGT